MKAAILSVALLAITGMTVAGQSSHYEYSFNRGWFLQAQAGVGETLGESSSIKDLISPAVAINVGYQFNPLWSIRMGVSGWQAKGHWVYPSETYKFNYVQPSVDVLFSLTNAICGYNPRRVVDVYAGLGIGANVRCHNDQAIALVQEGYTLTKIWDGTKLSVAGRGVAGISFNLSNHFALNLEVNANMLPDGFNSKNGGSADWQFNGLAGVVYTFGGRYTKTQIIRVVEAVEEYVEEVPVEIESEEPVVEEKIDPAPVQAPIKQSIQECIFFLINSSIIRQEEMPKIQELAEFLKNNPDCDVTIAGYADKLTGTEKYNLYLSKQRANSVAETLIGMGIAEDRIVIDAYGDTVQPFEQNNLNRVAIAISSNNSK